VRGKPDGDVFFPGIDPAQWVEVAREELPASEGDTASGTYVEYARRR
jgi:dihydrofolate reductase